MPKVNAPALRTSNSNGAITVNRNSSNCSSYLALWSRTPKRWKRLNGMFDLVICRKCFYFYTIYISAQMNLAMKRNLSILTLLCTLLIPSCKDKPTQPVHTVYVAGHELNSSGISIRGGYWKERAQVILSTNGFYASSIFLSGEDVYVCGKEVSPTGNFILKYWKNNTPVSLTNGQNDVDGGYIFVDGNNVYVAAGEFNGSVYVAKVWKNGVATDLTNGQNTAVVKGILVKGADVYVAGYEQGSTGFVAKYWKNGNEVLLSDGTSDGFATDITVAGSDVYVSGYQNINNKLTAVYWKNGNRIVLSSADFSFATSIFVANNTVYVSGSELTSTGTVAIYWQNGNTVRLSDALGDASATRIVVVGSDVYVAGYDGLPTNHIARYWKNGEAVALTDGTTNAFAFGLAVKSSMRPRGE